jgi:mannitol-1-/sugar-/sorbitol-6-/2-deoxyglucose-6-phosphatase
MIEAVIFDMDGVIIDSEPLWTEAQKEVFTSMGVDFDEKLALLTIGTGSYDTIDFWYRRQPWHGLSHQEVEDRIMQRLLVLVEQKGRMMDGLIDMLEFFKSRGLKIALASGSPYRLIDIVIQKFNIKKYFEVVYSGEEEQSGKPNPAIFLSTAKKLNVLPFNCLVVEDSFNGLIAAKAARMKAIGYLCNGAFEQSRFDFADLKLRSFKDFTESQYTYLQNLI